MIICGAHIVELPHEGLRHAIFYAMVDGGVAATCMVDPWGPAGSGARPFVSGFCVRPELRVRGVGAALLRYVIANAAGAGFPSLALYCHERNEAAQRFYRRHGFEAYHRDGGDLVFGRVVTAADANGGGI